MNIGICVYFNSIDELSGKVKMMLEQDFDTCQLISWNPKLWTDENAEYIKDLFDKNNAKISAFWCGWEGPCVWSFYEGQKTLGLVPPEYREMRIKNLCDGADFAKKIGVTDIITHMGFIPENPYDPNFEPFCNAVRKVATHLKQNDQYLLFETGQETPVTLLRCFETVNTDNLAVNLDTANVILYGKANPVDALDVIGKYVRNLHAKDGFYPTDGRELGYEVKLGDGKCDFYNLIKKLKQLNYDSYITIEREVEGDKQVEDIRYAKQYLEKIITQVEAETKKLKVGLVGVGGISGAHIPSWRNIPEAELVAICDIRPEQMEKYEDIKKYTNFDQMLDNEKFDIIDICLPTFLHCEYSLKAMNRGINVICEKPISLNSDDVELLYSTAAKNNVNYMIAQVLRFWPEYEFIKELYDNKKYGKLLSGSMSRLGNIPKWSWDNWMQDEKRSGLVPFDLHIHDVDFMVYAFGAPKNIAPFRNKQPGQDYINNIYDYGDFFISCEASWYASPYPFTSKFRFQFEHAVIAYENSKLTVYEENSGKTEVNSGSSESSGVINLPQTDAYFNEIRYFTDCVLNNVKPDKVKEQELKEVLKILKSI